MNFMVIFGAVFLIAISALIYFWNRFQKFKFVEKIAQEHKKLSRLIALVPVLVMIVFLFFKTVAMVVIILHLLAIWVICDLLGKLIKRIAKKSDFKIYFEGVFAICITVIYMSVAWYLAHHVCETDYIIETEKNIGEESIRIAMIADSHLGATFDGEGFAKHMETLAATNPDLVVVVGDFVDDDSKKKDMIVACEALGNLKTKYGVFFVFGNHDKGYYNSRDFKTADLVAELEKNGVVILEDEFVMLNDNVYLLGRQDKSTRNRAGMQQLVQNVDMSKYVIVLDHQPSDYDNQAAAGVDLVLSGHTHGGWLFPANIVSKYFGPDNRIYGTERRSNTDFIVTSGISDWALPFKTGTIAEFVIIDIK